MDAAQVIKPMQSSSTPGTFLANDIIQGHLSNVKQSFYLFDHANCINQHTRNMMTNFQIETLLNSKIYGSVILVSMRNFMKDLHFSQQENALKFKPQVLVKNTQDIKNVSIQSKLPNGMEIEKKEKIVVNRVDNLVLLNCQPMVQLGRNSVYAIVKAASNPAQALINILNAIVDQLQLNQASVVIDSLEYLQMLCRPADTLKLIQQITYHDGLYPFYCHVDFGLVKDQKFQQLVLKAQNGLFKYEKDTTKQGQKFALIYSSVVKPGNRFVDELSVIGGLNSKTNAAVGGVKLIGNKGPALEYFEETKTVDTVKVKQQAVKATFKIENDDQERSIKQQVNTTLYHTGTNNNAIKIDEEDAKEIEQSQLESLAETALRESSDEGDGDENDDYDDEDDPDDDLNF